jgi:hypothetical protein
MNKWIDRHKPTRIGIKIAPHLKIPYNSNQIGTYKNHYHPYMGMYNAMHLVENENQKTYFYIKNDTISYYNQVDDNISFFMLDLGKLFYRYIDLYKLNNIIGNGKFFVFGIGDDKQYLVLKKTLKTSRIASLTFQLPGDRIEMDRIKDITIVDVNNGKVIYMDSVEDVSCEYINAFGPIANTIIVIAKVTKKGIYITSLDVITGETNMFSVGLEDIKNIIMQIVNQAEELKELKDSVSEDNLRYSCFVYELFRTREIRYYYKKSEHNNSYNIYICSIPLLVALIGEEYEYLFDYLTIDVSVFQNYVHHSLGFSYSNLTINKLSTDKQQSRSASCTQYVNLPILFSHELSPHNNANNSYISNIIYRDDCFYIEWDNSYIKINMSGSSKNTEKHKSYLYKHNEYLLVLRLKSTNGYYEMLVINTKMNVSYLYNTYLYEMPYKNQTLNLRFYYFKSSNKLIILENELNYLFVLDLTLVGKFFEEVKNKALDHLNCRNRIYSPALHKEANVLQFLDINMLIQKAVYAYMMHNSRNAKENIHNHSKLEAKVLLYYVDDSSGKLYIIAEYVVGKIKYIGLFMYDANSDNRRLIFLQYFPDYMSYPILYRSWRRGSGRYEPDLSSIALHKRNTYRSTTSSISTCQVNNMKGLDITYKNAGYFASIMYNRYSLPLLDILKNKLTITYPDDIIVMEYFCLPSTQLCSTVFILAWSSLVKKTQEIVI